MIAPPGKALSSASLKEVAGRINKLSYREMLTLADAIHKEVADYVEHTGAERLSEADIARILLSVSDKIAAS